MTNVNEIFKDLACMVHDQGVVVDTIEGNIEAGAARVEAGTQELAKASRYQVWHLITGHSILCQKWDVVKCKRSNADYYVPYPLKLIRFQIDGGII